MRLAASQPPEARGLGRDGVRLLVATPDGMVHARFGDLPRFLSAGDLLVVNTSATIAAAVDGRRGDGRPVVVHFSSPLDEGTPWAGTLDGRSPGERARDEGTPGGTAGEGTPGETQWLVELRENAAATGPVTDASPGETLTLQAGGSLTLLRRYPGPAAIRMWAASVAVGGAPRRVPRPARPADPLLLRPVSMAAPGLPDGVRPHSRQRGDAERGPAVLSGPGHRSGSGRCRDRAGHLACRGGIARGW